MFSTIVGVIDAVMPMPLRYVGTIDNNIHIGSLSGYLVMVKFH